MAVSADSKLKLGDNVYYAFDPVAAVSDSLDWRITSCIAAEQVTVADGSITASGRTLDLIKVSLIHCDFFCNTVIHRNKTPYWKLEGLMKSFKIAPNQNKTPF